MNETNLTTKFSFEDCKACKGSGKGYDSKKCSLCNGLGQIEQVTVERQPYKGPIVWLIHEDQLKIYDGGNVVAAIPDHQFLKMIMRLSAHLDYHR
jgi:hypothetical protein